MSQGTASLSVAVVEAVADAEPVDPVDLSTPLADPIDPDAQDVLFQNGSGDVSFDYCGHEVTVGARGSVEITPNLHRGRDLP
jgi:hypothetical protein